MAKFNGLTLASNGALRALLAGTKTESDRNNAIAAVSHSLQGQPDGFGAHLTAISLAQAQNDQAHAERIEAAVRAFLPAMRLTEELRAAQIQELNKILGGMKIAIDPLPVHLSRAATSEQFNALARTIDQQMSDLARRQQDWRSGRVKEAAELREKVVSLDKTIQDFATSLDQLTHLYLVLAGVAGLMLGLIMFPATASLMDWVRHVTGW
jgi:DNA repair exonuclease SbcCD ATPase subunit